MVLCEIFQMDATHDFLVEAARISSQNVHQNNLFQKVLFLYFALPDKLIIFKHVFRY